MARRRSLWILVVVLLAHLPWLLLPSVNLEFAFVDAARYLAGGDRRLVDQYFYFQANSLGFPLLVRGAMAALPGLDPLLTARLVSLSGVVLLWAGVANLARQGRRPDTDALLIVLLLNPLVWTFSARATADLFPAALAVFAVSLVLSGHCSAARALAAGLLLGVAAVAKYHALLLSLYVIVVTAGQSPARRSIRPVVTALVVAVIMVAAYAWWTWMAFGFWLTPPAYHDIHRWTPSATPHNLIAYAGYVVLLTLPLSLLVPGGHRWIAGHLRAVVVAAAALFAAGAAALELRGEMGLGPLDRFFDPRVVGGMFVVLFAAFLLPLARGENEDAPATTRRRSLVLGTLAVLGVLAMTRPAQRYLLFVSPFHLLALPTDLGRMRRTVIATALAFVAANAYVGYAQWCTGSAARDLAARIEAAGLMPVTAAGDIESHVGDRFALPSRTGQTRQPAYVVRAGLVAGATMSVTRGWSHLARSYSLVAVDAGR